MENITNFIERLCINKQPYSLWVYACNGQYQKLNNRMEIYSKSKIRTLTERHLEVVAIVGNDLKNNAFLLISEVQAVVPIKFNDGRLLSFKV